MGRSTRPLQEHARATEGRRYPPNRKPTACSQHEGHQKYAPAPVHLDLAADHHGLHERLPKGEPLVVREHLEEHTNGSPPPIRKRTDHTDHEKNRHAALVLDLAELLAELHVHREPQVQNAHESGSTGGQKSCF